MRIRGDRDAHGAFFGHAQVSVFQVKPVGRGVAFHHHAVVRGRVQNFFHIVSHGVTPQQDASGGMADDLHVGIVDGRQHAFGDLRAPHAHE